jgi:hypothetical protein|tara:strand:- start:395 stop:601 length:207 start_codon:yes stop_codon:yes gene_type:complete
VDVPTLGEAVLLLGASGVGKMIRTGWLPPFRTSNIIAGIKMMTTKTANKAIASLLAFGSGMSVPERHV